MGIDWEEILGAEGEDLQDAYDANIPDEEYYDYDIPETEDNGGSPVIIERARGLFFGHEVSFKRVFSNHRFTDDEVRRLLQGEIIEITYQTKDAQEKTTTGRLQQRAGTHKKYFGFTPIFSEEYKSDYSEKDIEDGN